MSDDFLVAWVIGWPSHSCLSSHVITGHWGDLKTYAHIIVLLKDDLNFHNAVFEGTFVKLCTTLSS